MADFSVLDYFRSIISGKERIDLKEFFGNTENWKKPGTIKQKQSLRMTAWVVAASFMALAAQILLEPPVQHVLPASVIYLISGVLLYKNSNVNSLENDQSQKSGTRGNHKVLINKLMFITAAIFLLTAFYLSGSNQFTLLNTVVWVIGLVLLVYSLWQKGEKPRRVQFHFGIFLVVMAVFIMTSIFFRFYRLAEVPSEMFSDHAEKLLDVMDVLDGRTRIFFPRNTGREGLQFYTTAAIIQLLGTGISFTSLKIGTAMAGILALPFIYLTGKMLFNKWVGGVAVFLCGISYWHNVISRVGLRFPIYPLYASITVYFFLKGLREQKINDFILAGIAMGLGLHGYSPFRIMVFVLAAAVAIYLIMDKSGASRQKIFHGLIIFSIVTLAVFLPLLRYMIESPSTFHYRALTRLTPMERSFEAPILITLFDNIWKSMTMFFYRNGVIWVASIPNRPALDHITATFFFIGLIVMVKRVVKFKKWEEMFLLVSIPLLMLPSILSIAFPQENPALNRSSGAIIPVFLIGALGFFSVIKVCLETYQSNIIKTAVWLVAGILLIFSARNNYILVFKEYDRQFNMNAWNTSEIGAVIKDFVASGNDPDNAFVIPYPHWVDTRLVGMMAGFPRKDYGLAVEQIKNTLPIEGNKLFIIKPEDEQALGAVELIYPQAISNYFHSKTPDKDFYKIFVENQ